MALRQIMLAKQIQDKENELAELRVKTVDFETREKELEKAIGEANTDEERKAVEGQVDTFMEERDAHDALLEAAEGELDELRGELDKLNAKAPKNKTGGERKVMGRKNEDELDEIRSGINRFVKSKGQERDGFTSVEGGALIPEELLAPQMKPEEEVDLRNYVKVVPVNSSNGKYPVIAKSSGKMSTVAELANNPKLANPTITEINFEVATRRGYIPISQEVIDDAEYDVTGLIRDEIQSQSLNTSNADIAAKLKMATAKSVVGIDGLKDLVNKGIKKVYPVKFIISASLYAELDKLKDKNGRYLLQDSIIAASGKTLLGREVIVLDDDMIGTKAGDLVGFVGDAKSFMAFFDRKRTSVEWVDNQIYGKLLAGIVRYDVQVTDTEAGCYITYTNETPTEGA
ncbi:phage major capsid protein [Faecalicatena contorta]|uniref:phage major capsid protein n=1 Tax=Faecalicatena contorta TaxID=39482 RepID=UPI0031D72095